MLIDFLRTFAVFYIPIFFAFVFIFAMKGKGHNGTIGETILSVTAVIFIIIAVSLIVGMGVATLGASDEVLETNVVMNNDTLRAISSDSQLEGYMGGGLFIVSGYVDSQSVYKYYYLCDDGSYKQKSIPVDITNIVISDNTPAVIRYCDKVQTVYLGWIVDASGIRYENEHYTIVIPENGLSNEIYLE